MHVISRKRLNEFAAEHPDALAPLARWYRLMKGADLASFTNLRQTFPDADRVGNKTVFDIGGNKYRLIAAIHYNRQKVYIRAILTHAQYDRGAWKKD